MYCDALASLLPFFSGATTLYFQRWVRTQRPTCDSLIGTKTSSGQAVFFPAPVSSGTRERPCISSGTRIPAASRSVGGRSTRLTSSRSRPPPVKQDPERAVGTRIEASWQERLYSLLRVLKCDPW